MLGDLRVLDTARRAAARYASASALQALFDALRRCKIGFDAELHKRTLERGAALAHRPAARDAVAGAGLAPEAEHANARRRSAARRCVLVAHRRRRRRPLRQPRTPSACAPRCIEARRRRDRRGRGRGRCASSAGRPRYGVDLDDSVIPQEAGLNERAVSFTKGCYVGQETVARLHWRGQAQPPPARAAAVGEPVAARHRAAAGRARGRPAARASPSRRASARSALALVRREAQPGDVLDAGGVSAEVVDLPFAQERG